MRYSQIGIVSILAMLCSACEQKPDTTSHQQDQFEQQAHSQGYPVLIATPVSAAYSLPFCEKKYCSDIEIFSFQSQDQWFNQFTEQQIADLIRKRLGLTQQLNLQHAVNAFVQQSDAWLDQQQQLQNHHNKNNTGYWHLYIQPKVVMQQHEITIILIDTEMQLGEDKPSEQRYFYVLDRKQQQRIRLYDLVKEQARMSFNDEIQHQYQKWKTEQPQTADSELKPLPEKIFWANQDWFFDHQGIAVVYRGEDLARPDAKGFTFYLSPEQSEAWIKAEQLQRLGLR